MNTRIKLGILLLFGVLMLYSGWVSDGDREPNKDEAFCRSLDLNDYIYDCSEWGANILFKNTEHEKIWYAVTCTYKSAKTLTNVGGHIVEVGCGLGYITNNSDVRMMNFCFADTLDSAFKECQDRIPKELENITVILPNSSMEVA